MSIPYPRSPELMQAGDTTVVLVDVQEKLVPALHSTARLQWNASRLLFAAEVLGIPIIGTEQYPHGLGRTIAALSRFIAEPLEKLTFSCAGAEIFRRRLQELGRRKVLVCGAETHVCIQQTVLDLISMGYAVYVPVDGVSSRHEIDHATALRRMETSGATLTTTEAVMFEWCGEAGTDAFKAIRLLVTQTAPEA